MKNNNKKNTILTILCTLMLFIPWTILPLRSFQWALESPVAEIMISCYAAFMIFSGIFTAVLYAKLKIQHNLMKICVVINGIYALGGVIAFVLMAVPKKYGIECFAPERMPLHKTNKTHIGILISETGSQRELVHLRA